MSDNAIVAIITILLILTVVVAVAAYRVGTLRGHRLGWEQAEAERKRADERERMIAPVHTEWYTLPVMMELFAENLRSRGFNVSTSKEHTIETLDDQLGNLIGLKTVWYDKPRARR